MKRIFPILIAALCIACFALPVFGCAPSENDDGDGGDTMTEEEYQHYGAYSYYYYPQLGRDVMPVGAWCAPPTPNYGNFGNPNYITDENDKTMAQSGIKIIPI